MRSSHQGGTIMGIVEQTGNDLILESYVYIRDKPETQLKGNHESYLLLQINTGL